MPDPRAASLPGRLGALARPVGLALAWALSILPLVYGPAFEASLGDASRLAMVWLPWMVVAGWPAAPGATRDWPLLLGLALPIAGLAAWFDTSAGLGLGRLEATFAAGLVVSVCLGEARVRAAEGRVRTHAPLWLLLLVVLPALAVSLAWGAGERLADEGLAGWLQSFSPVLALWRDVQPLEGDLARQGVESAVFCGSTVACVLLVAWTSVAAGRRSR